MSAYCRVIVGLHGALYSALYSALQGSILSLIYQIMGHFCGLWYYRVTWYPFLSSIIFPIEIIQTLIRSRGLASARVSSVELLIKYNIYSYSVQQYPFLYSIQFPIEIYKSLIVYKIFYINIFQSIYRFKQSLDNWILFIQQIKVKYFNASSGSK